MYKKVLAAIIGLIIAGALLTIGQIWGPLFSGDIYYKMIVTLGIIVIILGLILAISSDLGQHKKLKDDNYLD